MYLYYSFICSHCTLQGVYVFNTPYNIVGNLLFLSQKQLARAPRILLGAHRRIFNSALALGCRSVRTPYKPFPFQQRRRTMETKVVVLRP